MVQFKLALYCKIKTTLPFQNVWLVAWTEKEVRHINMNIGTYIMNFFLFITFFKNVKISFYSLVRFVSTYLYEMLLTYL